MKLSDTMLDSMLAFDNITTANFYGKRNAFGGNVPLENSSSSDADIEISIHYSQTESSESGNRYVLWAYATLLKQPVILTNDRLHLTNDAVFNSHYREYGSVLQVGYCKKCSEYITNLYDVSDEKRRDGDLLLEYERRAPSIHFEVSKAKCPTCLKSIENVSFTSFVQYGFITKEPINVNLEYVRDNILKDKYTTGIIIHNNEKSTDE
ncbi:MAG: hypothetical protein IJZ53_13545 [Tyzzerella sp.]|nr:hypothetical protein [Tyzzerella sp.]